MSESTVAATTPNGDAAANGMLDAFGRWILAADTRVVLIGAVIIAVVIGIVLASKGRKLATDSYVHLGLTLAQIYSAGAIFAVLVLTDPPAFGKLDPFARQSAGLIACIVLIMGVVQHVLGLFGEAKSARTLTSQLEELAANVSTLGDGKLTGDPLKSRAEELAKTARSLASDSATLVTAAEKIVQK